MVRHIGFDPTAAPTNHASTFSVDQMREGLEDGTWNLSSITIRAIGAGGAGDGAVGSRAGDGGYSSAIVQIPIGTQLNIVIGLGGSNSGPAGTLAQGGGGRAYYSNSGSGGGFSGVFSGSSTPPLDNVLQANALVIAGGGGGGGYANVTSTGGAFGDTGEGGGLSGDNGTANGGSGPPYRWGYGGTQVAGGAGGVGRPTIASEIGQDGSALQGGDGNYATGGGGGGGGGGWFGGGGGAWKTSDGVGGGGGGSGYITPSATSGSTTVLGGAGGTLPASLSGNSYGLTAWSSANHGAVEIIDNSGSTVYTYTGTAQTHIVA